MTAYVYKYLRLVRDTRGAAALGIECRERGMPLEIALAILRS